jgi:hypothetical protein
MDLLDSGLDWWLSAVNTVTKLRNPLNGEGFIKV